MPPPLPFPTPAPQGGDRTDPLPAGLFAIEIEGLVVGGFAEVEGLEVHIQVLEYREGGVNDHVHRFPQHADSPTLKLRRGVIEQDTLWTWQQEVIRGRVRRRNGTIFLLGADRTPELWWTFTGAYPVGWTGPRLDATGANVALEMIELVHTGLSRSTRARAPSESPAARFASTVLAFPRTSG